MILYATGEVEHRGVSVTYTVSNEFALPEWDYLAEDRHACVWAYQDRDDDDVTGPVLHRLFIEGEAVAGQWAWDVCHRLALDYVAFATVPLWEADR